MKKTGTPIQVEGFPAEYEVRLNLKSARHPLRNRVQPYTIWQGDETIYFARTTMEALLWLMTEEKNASRV